MSTTIEQINSLGRAFVEFAWPMLVQSSVLILILLIVDLALRKKVRAVFRYWIWMLILVKLVLPTSLSSPVSLGYWLGDKLPALEIRTDSTESDQVEPAPMISPPIIDLTNLDMSSYTPPVEPMSVAEPVASKPSSPPELLVTPVKCQGIILLAWLAVAAAMGLLLLQRALFVRGLVAQSRKANRPMSETLEQCRRCIGVRRKVGLKVSPNVTTPAVCGLFRPVILVPQNLGPNLGSPRLRTVLLHELTHIKRGDLWANLAQTALQIIYFYNPLLWLANAIIRRVREQAVDEAVLVAMGEKAQQYPQTLVDVAKLAFKRPALSLRLIGVVESKSALTARIKHILSRPMPKSAKLGVLGLLAVLIAAAVLLPMAAADKDERSTANDISHGSQFTTTLANGVMVELVGLTHHVVAPYENTEPLTWWRADGGESTISPYWRLGRSRVVSSDETCYDVLLDIQGAEQYGLSAGTPLARADIPHLNPLDVDGERMESFDKRVIICNFKKNQDKGTVRIGVASDPWRQMESWKHRWANGEPHNVTVRSESALVLEWPRQQENSVVVEITHKYTNEDRQLLVVGKDGKTHRAQSRTGVGTGVGLTRDIYRFDNLERKDMDTLKFQTRPYHWVHFKNVSLKPGVKTNVLIEPRQTQVQVPIENRPYVITFAALDQDKAKTSKQLFDLLRSPSGVRIFQFRSETVQGRMQGRMSVEDEAAKNKIVECLRENEDITLVDARPAYTIVFKSADSQTIDSHKLLDTFRENYPRGVNTYRYQSMMQENQVVGYISVSTCQENDKLVQMIQENKRIDLVAVLGPNWKLDATKEAASEGNEEPAARDNQETGPKFIATVHNGVTVELMGVCEHPSEGKQWWRPDGQILDTIPYAILGWSSSWTGSSPPALWRREFAVRVSGDNQCSFAAKTDSGIDDIWVDRIQPKTADGKKIKDMRAFLAVFRGNINSGDVGFGVACGPWEKVEEWGPHDWSENITDVMSFQSDKSVILTWPRDYKKGFVVTVTHGFVNEATRLVLTEKNGRHHTTGEPLGRTASGMERVRYTFLNVKREDIERFVFEKRPYQWVTFKNVSLRPGSKTDVQVEINQAPKESDIQNQVLSFGPEVKRILGLDCAWIDLETGSTQIPPSKQSSNEEQLQWCRESGVDVAGRVATGRLDCLDVEMVKLDDQAWTGLSVDGLRRALKGDSLIRPSNIDGLPTVALDGKSEKGTTYGFRTREGTLGVLKIDDFWSLEMGPRKDNPNLPAFITILYKLALSPEMAQTAILERPLSIGEQQYLDLDSGEYVFMPGENVNPEHLKNQGVDIYLVVEKPTPSAPPTPMLNVLAMATGRAPHKLYLQQVPANSDSLSIAIAHLNKPQRLRDYGGHSIHFFRTAQGKAGAMKIKWLSDEPPRRVLRYKFFPALDIPIERFPWTLAVNGVQSRLRAGKTTWKADETPTLSLDLRNSGEETIDFVSAAQAHCEIQIDGAWYGWAEPIIIDAPVRRLEPATELNDAISIKLTNSWALPRKTNKLKHLPGVSGFWGRRLELTPGKHTVRVRFRTDDWLQSYMKNESSLSVVSNPVEIEILPAERKPDVQVETEKPERTVELTQLLEELQDTSHLKREEAARKLGELRDTRAVEALIAALKDGDVGVRAAASRALGKIADKRAVEPLIAAYHDQEYESFIDAIWALGDIGGPRAEQILLEALNYQGYHPYVTNIAAKCLTKLGWKPQTREQTVRYLIALENWEEAIKSGTSVRRSGLKPEGTNQAEGPVEINIPIVIPLEADKQTPAIAKYPWLQFSATQGKLNATLHIRYSSWPHTKWLMKIDVLDAGGKVLGQAERIHSNSGIIERIPQVENAEILFGFAHGLKLVDAAKFRFSVESFWTSQGNPIQFDKEIPLALELSSAEQPRTIHARWVKFERTDDRVEGTIHLKYLSWPKAKWEVGLRVLDRNGKQVTGRTDIIENKGIVLGVPAVHEKDLRFSLGSWQTVSQAVRYVVEIQRILDPTSKTDVQAAGSLAWQRTDRYVPPNPEEFFPDDPAGGRRLDALFDAVDKNRRSDEEIISTVRQGFRRTTKHRTLILAWIGNRYIWGKDPQNPAAIGIMYHAVPMERHYAIYFGLSVVRNKTPNILRTLADICIQGEDVGRITWGVGSQRDELVSYIKPYLENEDAQKREIASVLLKHFRGELDFEEWKRQQALDKKEIQFGDQLPQFREQLLTGNSHARREVLNLIRRNNIGCLLDNSFLEAMKACAQDSDPDIRRKVASIAGGRWIWGAKEQNPEALELMLKLASDDDRGARYNAVYFGLSTVHAKTEPVIRRLVELALADHENNLYGRIVWGLRKPARADSELVKRILAEQLDGAKSDLHLAASVYLLYKDLFEAEPPGSWGLEQVIEHYPDDIFIVQFSAKEPFQPENTDALWKEFHKNLPAGIDAERSPNIYRQKLPIIFTKVRGTKARDHVKQTIESNPRLRLGQAAPFPLQMQLFFEEMQGPTESEETDVQAGVEEGQANSERQGAVQTTQEEPSHAGRIRGIVVSSVTGKTIAGAYVGVGDFGDSGGSNYARHREQGFYAKTKTDEKGQFELDGLVFTDEHPELNHHPLVVTHPDSVRHDQKIELPAGSPVPEVKVALRPAANISVTVVDSDGNPIEGHWLLRLEALDGRRFIPPGSDPHLSSFASSIWAQWPDLRKKMGVSQGFKFTQLDTGEYLIEAMRFHLVDNPTPQNIWKPTVTYHGSIPSLKIQAGQSKQVKLPPDDWQTRLTVTPPEFPDMLMGKLKRSPHIPPMCVLSRNLGLLLWDDGKVHHLEDQRLGRIDKKRFFRGFFPQAGPLTINNLPPGSYSLFAVSVYGQVAACLIGAHVDIAKADDAAVQIPWRQPEGPSRVGPNRAFDYPVKLQAREYTVAQLCEILTEMTDSNPRLTADRSIQHEKLKFNEREMSVWDLLEKLFLDKGWKVQERPEKTLVLQPGVNTSVEAEKR